MLVSNVYKAFPDSTNPSHDCGLLSVRLCCNIISLNSWKSLKDNNVSKISAVTSSTAHNQIPRSTNRLLVSYLSVEPTCFQTHPSRNPNHRHALCQETNVICEETYRNTLLQLLLQSALCELRVRLEYFRIC